MARRELHVELLLNCRVDGLDGRSIGRLEEVRAERRGGQWVVTEYLVGAYALFERLAASSVGRAILGTLGARRKGAGYRVPWDRLDLTNPSRPKLICAISELKPIAKDR